MLSRTIYPPKNGWQNRTWYIVDVSYSKFNPIHRALFFTGFLPEGKPGSYNRIVAINGTDFFHRDPYNDVVYLKAIKQFYSLEEPPC